MEDHPVPEPGHHLRGRAYVDEHRVRGEHPFDRRRVRRLHALRQPGIPAGDAVQGFQHPRIRAGGRHPGDIDDRNAGAAQIVGEPGQTDVHHARSVREQVGGGQLESPGDRFTTGRRIYDPQLIACTNCPSMAAGAMLQSRLAGGNARSIAR